MDHGTLRARLWANFGRLQTLLGGSVGEGRVIEREGLLASIVPGAPESPTLNAAVALEPDVIPGHLGELEERYRAAGIRRWGVWLDASATPATRALYHAGLSPTAQSPGMGADIEDVDNGRPRRLDADLATVGRVNDLAYGNHDQRLERTLTPLPNGILYGFRADLDDGTPGAVALAHLLDAGLRDQLRRHDPARPPQGPRDQRDAAGARARPDPGLHDHDAPGHGRRRAPVRASRLPAAVRDAALGAAPMSADPAPQHRRRRKLLLLAKRAATLLIVIAATAAGAYGALATYTQERELSVGQIRLSADPGHTGALDLYVPLVDWGVRFEDAIRAPIRLHVDLRTLDRRTVATIAEGETPDLTTVRAEARDAIASYLKTLLGIVVATAAAFGLLVAFAIRHRTGPKLRYTTLTAITTAIAIGVGLVVLLPPRGTIDEPQYYAFGPDIPRALEAVETAQRSTNTLDQELDAQLVGLARLVTRPSERTPLTGRPHVTIASDLHNNVLAIPILERATDEAPLLFVGDLTDRGSPVETRLVQRVVSLGDPFVFVSGNHDSDTLSLTLAQRGAIVLTQRGRLNPDGTYGEQIQEVNGLRIAGFSDPYERRSREGFADRFDNAPTPAMQNAFTAWLRPLINNVDVVMVHEPALIEPALEELAAGGPPVRPLVFAVGHTHSPSVERLPGVTVINGGSVGAGGTGNLAEPTNIGIARLIYNSEPAFEPLAADLVEIDPGDGSATARRQRLDEPEPENDGR